MDDHVDRHHRADSLGAHAPPVPLGGGRRPIAVYGVFHRWSVSIPSRTCPLKFSNIGTRGTTDRGPCMDLTTMQRFVWQENCRESRLRSC